MTPAPEQPPRACTAVWTYIRRQWIACVRELPADRGTLIGLPFPYVVPAANGMFQELYYWDTYFTNRGLIGQGLLPLARFNTDNLLTLIERYGFVPNGNRTYYLRNTQPPYLSMMVRDVYARRPDRAWLAWAVACLEREYAFWMRERLLPVGLNRYGTQVVAAEARRTLFAEFAQRLGWPPDGRAVPEDETLAMADHFTAGCESGWDFSPRFDLRYADWVPIDLNSNLYVCGLSHFPSHLI